MSFRGDHPLEPEPGIGADEGRWNLRTMTHVAQQRSQGPKSRRFSTDSLGSNRNIIAGVAILSRLVLWSIAVTSAHLGSAYDASTALPSGPWRDGTFSDPPALQERGQDSLSRPSYLDATLQRKLLAPFVRWDAVYFLKIAEAGYTYEHEFAFFPGLPLLMRALSAILPSCGLERRTILMLMGVTISNVAFVGAAVVLYRLGCRLLNERLAFTAAILFCVTPAGLFMSAIYTESLFALLSFIGMALIVDRRYMLAAIAWALATAVRSNGIVYAGFFAWSLIILPLQNGAKLSVACSLGRVFQTLILCTVVAAPFLGFQYYAYHLFCGGHPQQELRPWCMNAVPSLYNFVQKEYWNNGFLRYYRPQQIPNFVLAAPIFTISVAGIREYVKHDPLRFVSIGFRRSTRNGNGTNWVIFSSHLLPYVYLWTFLTFYCATMMHVQVVVRFFTSMPCVYWFAAYLVLGNVEGRRQGSQWGKAILTYFVLYGMVTTVLFANFLPPA
ncbi:GPI-anchor transamidase GPI18 [Spizellomyces punctatus DAOM BR117]|uniref:GPI mannosyltransferase 2 n=1 Tax=Spizellomyces punctatus (strain DAOM BR117) TaxID=645134 RepID=A0A0L0HFW3_SPIPD|nr:GPI-anchor transamidase GPI18 [Spizellomyces punctatus DAOM BR117]KND00381.1 hypothetical protein SPPG_04705 [Spizellomyces punctatus DAOM BR117]|eukprot:XP_016608420.1 hypothetical protein SPPG_04705 [Spizellomyces punctatus DAOM BR117]